MSTPGMMTIIAVASALITLLVAIDGIALLLTMHGPFTATGEVLLFLLSFGRRKPRFTKHLWRSPAAFDWSTLASLLRIAALGASFWILLALVALYAYGPLPQVHEW